MNERIKKLEEIMQSLLEQDPKILVHIRDGITDINIIKYLDAKHELDFLNADDDKDVLFHGTNFFCDVIESGKLKGSPLCLACDFESSYVYQGGRNLNTAVFAIMKRGIDYNSLSFVAMQVRTFKAVPVSAQNIKYVKFQYNQEIFEKLPAKCRTTLKSLAIPLISADGNLLRP